MNEEMKNLEAIENTDVMEICDDAVSSGNGIVGKLVVGAVVVGAGVAALLYKNRAKLEERRVRKLEKKGYVIYRPGDFDYEEENSEDSENAE